MLSLVRGDGGALLVEGSEGSGRSRLLDACVLEAKLLGATVLRADQSDGAAGDWGVARELGSQLCELMPAEASEAARLSRYVLAHLIDALREGGSTRPTPPPERSLILRELRDFILAMSRGQRLLIAVDDVDRIDEPSAALLAALAHKTEKHSLMLALTTDRVSDVASSPSVRLLRSVATSIVLEHLDVEQTEALVRSVFGDADNLRLVAGRIHALSHGNPRAAMELCQHLCDRGLARYQAGSWSLPSTLDEGDLPNTLAISLATRLSGLSQDARELCEILALADGDPLTLPDYPELTEHGDHVRVFRALDETVAARVMLADAERYRFAQRGFISVLHESIDDARKQSLHARLADAPKIRACDPLRLAHHLMEGGRDREAVELLCRLDLPELLPPLPLLERALATSERLAMPARMTHALRTAVVTKAPMVFAVGSFRRQLQPVLDQLEQDSGLRCYRELEHLPPGERLSQALARTQERFERTPEAERVYPILDAIRELAKFSANFCSIALQLMDLEFLESLPSLEPLKPLSPSLTVVADLIEGGKEGLRGRTTRTADINEAVLRRIAEPDRAGFDETYHRGIRLGIHYMLGLFDASMGIDAAEQRAQLLEADREHRVNAWRVRLSLHLNQGNAEEARKCMRRAELLQLQEGSEQRYLGTSAGFELVAQAQVGDLLGVKRALDNVTELAQHYRAWRPVLLLGQCEYRKLQGDLTGALEAIESALPLAPPGRHPYFPYVAAAHVHVLLGLGRVHDAVVLGRQYAEVCRREGFDSLDRWVYLVFAQALARNGEYVEALTVIDAVIAVCEQRRMGGMSIGAVYETRARIAIWMDDRTAFARYSELCATEYKKGRNPALAVKFARLMEEARQSEPHETLPPRAAVADMLELSQTETGMETIQSRMLECVDENDRARCALTILLQSSDSFAGYLFGVRADTLVPLAGLPEVEAETGLARWLDACLKAELVSQASATATADGDDEEHGVEPAMRYTDAEGRCFEPIFLVGKHEQGERIAAVLAMQIAPGPRTVPPKELLAEIADQLFDHGDVSGVPI
jgi:tetratricopeptide (TPR) repeat protein